MKTKYPPIEPWQTGYLDVGSNHRIYYEQSGDLKGLPVVFLHGGPGACCHAGHRQYFNPQKYRIILLDQRGCGKSLYQDRFKDNTTQHLIEDLEMLRKHLKISSWIVFGGSWGAFLGLSYAICHPNSVKAMILRGLFLGSQKQMRWLYEFGASEIHPEQWEVFAKPKIDGLCNDLVSYYHQKLFSSDEVQKQFFAAKWAAWELINVFKQVDETIFTSSDFLKNSVEIAQIELHYFKNNCFLADDDWIFNHLSILEAKPLTLIVGRYDLVTPVSSSFQVHQRLKNSKLLVLPSSGHSSQEEAMIDALVDATDNLLSMLAF